MIPYGRQQITEEDIDAVVDVLRSDFLTQGPAVPAFEKAICKRMDVGHGVASTNATSSLHLAYAALGVGPGDVVWTSPVTFVATANAALMCGAEVDFVDIDPTTFLMDPSLLADKLTRAKRDGALPKVVAPTHLAGRSCDMKSIAGLAEEFGFHVVEDAAHAVGASYDGVPVGACPYSDIAVFSFHPVKIITTGEGGLATTQDPNLAERMALLRSHGITREPAALRHAGDGDWYYEQLALGFNYRMTDIQAALGLSQLQRLSDMIARRRQLVRRYAEQLEGGPLKLPDLGAVDESAWHLFIVQVDAQGERRKALHDGLRQQGIGTQVHYIPVHMQPYYQDKGFRTGMFPHSEDYYARSLSLPMYAGLSDADHDRVIAALQACLAEV